MGKLVRITPELAHVPDALPAFLLKADRPLPYRWWTRLSDHLAGRRDRLYSDTITLNEPPVAQSPWLQRQLAECATALARGRTRTEALVAVLDRELASLAADADQQAEALASLQAQLVELESAPVGDGIVGAGEVFSPPHERQQRRRRERAAQFAQLQRATADAEAARRDIDRQINTLNQERRSHWVVLQERSRQLVELYQRRVCTYTRGMEQRRKGIVLTAPTVATPAWVSAQLGTGGVDAAGAAAHLRLATH